MLQDPRTFPDFCPPNRLVRPLAGGWDWQHTFQPGERVTLDLGSFPVEFDQASDMDLIGCAWNIVRNGFDLDLNPAEGYGNEEELKSVIRALHGRGGVVTSVAVSNDGGYTDYISVELWGGGTLHAISAIHLRPRS